jgi:hypothetical protein
MYAYAWHIRISRMCKSPKYVGQSDILMHVGGTKERKVKRARTRGGKWACACARQRECLRACTLMYVCTHTCVRVHVCVCGRGSAYARVRVVYLQLLVNHVPGERKRVEAIAAWPQIS